MQPFRFLASWRAVLRNYKLNPPALIGVQPKRAFDQPPTPEPLAIDGLTAYVGPWEWVVKPLVRDYFRAELQVRDDTESPILQVTLIVDPYDEKIGMTKLREKIVTAMYDAIALVRSIEMHVDAEG